MRISDLSSDVCSSDLWNFLDSVAFSQMRELVGLDAMKVAISGAAPIAGELISWFRALGVPLSEIYGMSESTALMAWEPYRVRAGTVGRRSEEHTSELQSLMRISYAVFCLKKKNTKQT